MQPYELVNHITEDVISELVDDNYTLLRFPDNIRLDHSLTDPGHFLTDKSTQGSYFKKIPENVEWQQKQKQHDLSVDVWHNGWVNTKDICANFGLVNQNLRSQVDYNFIQHSWEPIYYQFDIRLWDYLAPRPRHTVVLHSESMNANLQRLHERGIHTAYWFSHAYLCSEIYFKHYAKLRMVKDYTSRPIRSAWICANRLIDGPRTYRLEFLNMLDVTQGTYSLLNTDPYTGRTLDQIYNNNSVPSFSFDDHGNSSAEIRLDELTPWNTSFLHIVNETVWQEKIHFTEKIFKPIVLHQPFVVLQAPGSLEYLRSYGFRTFGEWWDESYDSIQDPQERMQAIADIVNWIPTQDLNRMRTEMSGVLEHNFRHFYENIPDMCLDELRRNVKNAI